MQAISNQLDSMKSMATPIVAPVSEAPPPDPELEALRQKVSQLIAERLALKQTIEELTQANEQLRKQESEEEARNHSLTGERDTLQAKNTGLKKTVQEVQTRRADSQRRLDEATRQRTALAGEITRLNWSLQQMSVAIATVGAENAALAKTIDQRRKP